MIGFGREFVFTRAATIEVKPRERVIELIAVPWDQEADIVWRGEMWHEVFSRGAFDGIEDHAGRVPVNRDHDRRDLVGKVVKFEAGRNEGLYARVQIARTARGEDTLALAEDDMLSASVGYYVKTAKDVSMDRRTMLRRVNRAFLEHLALVPDPAYDGARVLAVREDMPVDLSAATRQRVATPTLDEFVADETLAFARDYKPRER